MKKSSIPKSSFLYRFVIRFIFMIILPILCAWSIYIVVLNCFYSDNTLSTQQINMENSLSTLNSSFRRIFEIRMKANGNRSKPTVPVSFLPGMQAKLQ
jgi:flagellar biosynthesis protein FlhB